MKHFPIEISKIKIAHLFFKRGRILHTHPCYMHLNSVEFSNVHMDTQASLCWKTGGSYSHREGTAQFREACITLRLPWLISVWTIQSRNCNSTAKSKLVKPFLKNILPPSDLQTERNLKPLVRLSLYLHLHSLSLWPSTLIPINAIIPKSL